MNWVAFVVAAICFAVVALLGFGVFSGAHILGWLGLGLIATVVGLTVGFGVPGTWRRP